MASARQIVIWIAAAAILAAIVTVAVVIVRKARPVTLRGAVVSDDPDPEKQQPIADVQITGSNGFAVSHTTSDTSGFFSLVLPKGLRIRQSVKLRFRHPDYEPLDLNEFVGNKLYLVHMVPLPRPVEDSPAAPVTVVSNVRVRYSVKTTTEANVGSAVKTFQVVNQGNVPCNGHPPCSPDGKWRAAIGTTQLDAGEGGEFRGARVSCIAGPCPFTRVEYQNLSRGGRILDVAARNWSDTATFLIEAEVVRPMVSHIVRESYPVIFGPALNFSLPASAEGLSILADINAESIVFPMGPALRLSWATCHVRFDKDQSRTYRCELRPGFGFK
ncbi:MAG TPA: hypothetical protein VKB77_15010 [Terriglobales bacterium]|nr:hypothetical protein [Terriglobales bacterium]